MTAMLIHYMAPIMFASLVIFLLLGYPVAFSLAANGLIFGLLGIELGLFRPDFLQALPERIYGIMNNDVLLAIPFFTFMGLILERSGMAEDLLDTIGQLFGTIRGGLAYGATDELGMNATEKPVHVHDLHATILHLLGIDHERLTYRYAGRDFRLTDVSGRVVRDIMS